MLLERHFAFFHEHFRCVGLFFSDALALSVCVGLWEAQAEENNEDWRAGSKPEQRSPFMPDRVDEGTSENGRQEVSKGVSLLKHARYDTTCEWWTIFECCDKSAA